MARTEEQEKRELADTLLAEISEAQNNLWDATYKLEQLMGIEIDTSEDLGSLDYDQMLEMRKEQNKTR